MAKRVDTTHAAIRYALRAIPGLEVLDVHQLPRFVDLLVCQPRTQRVWLVEAKSARGAMRPSQAKLLRAGWPVIVLRSVDEAIAWAAAIKALNEDNRTPRPVACKHGDPSCPCQDGDPCHYEDTADTKAMSPPPPAEAREELTLDYLDREVKRLDAVGVLYRPGSIGRERQEVVIRQEFDAKVRALRAQVQALEQERDAAQAWAREQSMEERDLRARVQALERNEGAWVTPDEAKRRERTAFDRAIAVVEGRITGWRSHSERLNAVSPMAAELAKVRVEELESTLAALRAERDKGQDR